MGTATTAGPGTDLLAQSLDYTGAVLGVLDERPPPLARPTPCRDWDLGLLLAHMEDSLDAFAEGAAGEVSLDPSVPVRVRTAALRGKACWLLRAWSAAPGTVRVGDQHLPAQLVAVAAALEITVHGWDVARALGLDRPIPDQLARALLSVAPDLVADEDRVQRFAPPLAVDHRASAETRLLAFLGRPSPADRAAARTASGEEVE